MEYNGEQVEWPRIPTYLHVYTYTRRHKNLSAPRLRRIRSQSFVCLPQVGDSTYCAMYLTEKLGLKDKVEEAASPERRAAVSLDTLTYMCALLANNISKIKICMT